MDLGADFADGVLVRKAVDNGDGTWTNTDYTTDPPTVTMEGGKPIPDVAVDLSAEITAAKASLAAATTISQVRARTIALFDLLNTEA